MSAPPTPLLKLASGGSATVWLARAADGALVAVKRPHPHLFDEPGFATALAREASIAARLRHPHLVSVRGLSGEGADTALVMEYVEGCSLATLIRAWREQAPRATAGAAITIVLAVADALAAVHGARGEDGEPLGLVHRDVSPENVLVALDGGVKLIDFGLARSVGRGDRSTTGGVLKGKAGYLAPEYVRGAPIDHRIDLFALGIVLFEALTRQRLFLGENEADTLQRVLAARVPKLAEAGIDLGDASARLDAVLARALARAPADRYFEAAELATELRAAAEGMELGARAVAGAIGGEAREEIEGRRARIGRGVEKRTRRGWGWGLAGVGGVAVAVAAGVGIGAMRGGERGGGGAAAAASGSGSGSGAGTGGFALKRASNADFRGSRAGKEACQRRTAADVIQPVCPPKSG